MAANPAPTSRGLAATERVQDVVDAHRFKPLKWEGGVGAGCLDTPMCLPETTLGSMHGGMAAVGLQVTQRRILRW